MLIVYNLCVTGEAEKKYMKKYIRQYNLSTEELRGITQEGQDEESQLDFESIKDPSVQYGSK